jgi:hypothetical protein
VQPLRAARGAGNSLGEGVHRAPQVGLRVFEQLSLVLEASGTVLSLFTSQTSLFHEALHELLDDARVRARSELEECPL